MKIRQFHLPVLTVAAACILSGPPASAQNVSATAAVDSVSIALGDWLHLTIEAKFPSGASVYFPALTDSVGPFDILHRDSLIRTDDAGITTFTQKLTIASYREGRKTIPPIAIPYRPLPDTVLQYARTDSVPVEVRIIAVDTSAQLRDIKPPLSVPITLAEVALYAGIAAAAVLAGYFLYKYYRKRKGSAAAEIMEKPKIPAHIIALRKLDELEAKRLWQQGEIKLFYSDATEIVREYFESRFGILALEMTTGEVMMQLGDHIGDETVRSVVDTFLSEADLVKFAKRIPDLKENEKVIPTARTIVEETTPDVAVAAEAEETASHG